MHRVFYLTGTEVVEYVNVNDTPELAFSKFYKAAMLDFSNTHAIRATYPSLFTVYSNISRFILSFLT